MSLSKLFRTGQLNQRTLGWGDAVVLLGVIAILYIGVRLALQAPDVVQGPDISLALDALPWYGVLSVGRMAAAYVLSLLFTLVYGYVAAYNRRAEKVLMPLLDVLQSVPILSFLPVVYNCWLRLKWLELPFAAGSLIWNSMMSWAGGWFFLMAAESFTVGQRDFRLPGLGSYLQEAANQGDVYALSWGILTLVFVVVLLTKSCGVPYWLELSVLSWKW